MIKKALLIPVEVRKVFDEMQKAGFEAHLVGGCIRDLFRNEDPKDWDITTNATPEEIQKVFPDSFYENNFGTVGVKTGSEDLRMSVVEITPYRTESKYSDSRRPDKVEWAKTLEEDLARRDFTINAIAYDPVNEEVTDPYSGIKAIKEKRLTAVGNAFERFSEDALRMLRAIRLSAELEFIIESETLMAIASNSHLLEKISKERIRDEFLRIIDSKQPMQAIFVAQKLDILKHIIPELEQGIGCAQNQAHAFDVFEHNLRALQHGADKGLSTTVRISALLHDIGKPESRGWSPEKRDHTFYGHEVIGAKMAKNILENLRMPKSEIEKITTLVRWHMFFSDPDSITLSAVRRTIAKVGKENIQDLLQLRMCDRIGTGRPKEQPFRLRKYISMVDEALRSPVSVGQIKIDGNKIKEITNEKPGRKIGWALHALLEEVLDDPSKNNEEYLIIRAKNLMSLNEEELKKLGEIGKDRKEEEEQKEIKKLRKKYNVD